MFVGDTPDASDWARLIAGAFELTPAETRVLTGILAGWRLSETAAKLGVVSTARTHLDSIFAKTGVARQPELMRLAMQLSPPRL